MLICVACGNGCCRCGSWLVWNETVSQVFTTGVKEITTEPAFYNNVVEFNGSYYKVGGKQLEVRDLKVENDNFYILTLAEIAKELNRRGMRNANILLSVGFLLQDLEQRSWTIDIMPIEDSAPNEAECITIREGLIKCMRTINEECMR